MLVTHVTESLLRLASPHPLHPLQISKAAAKAAAKKQQQKQQHTCRNSYTPCSPITFLAGHSPLVLTVVFFILDRFWGVTTPRFWGVTTPPPKHTHFCLYFFFSLPHTTYIRTHMLFPRLEQRSEITLCLRILFLSHLLAVLELPGERLFCVRVDTYHCFVDSKVDKLHCAVCCCFCCCFLTAAFAAALLICMGYRGCGDARRSRLSITCVTSTRRLEHSGGSAEARTEDTIRKGTCPARATRLVHYPPVTPLKRLNRIRSSSCECQ